MWGENSLKMWDPQAKISLAGARAGKMLFPLFWPAAPPSSLPLVVAAGKINVPTPTEKKISQGVRFLWKLGT